MKDLYSITISICFFVFSSVTHAALDTKIRVLALVTPEVATKHLDKVKHELESLLYVWKFNGYIGVDVELVNEGIPEIYHSNLPRAMKTAFIGLYADESVRLLRNLHEADIIAVFSGDHTDGGHGLCGGSVVQQWIGPGSASKFVPDVSTGLDLRGKDNAFITIVDAITPACNTAKKFYEPSTLSHEFGHLLGGYHQTKVSGSTNGVYDDSHAELFTTNDPIIGRHTAVSPVVDRAFDSCTPSLNCLSSRSFSNSPGARNHKAVSKTALSVANYINSSYSGEPGDPPPPPPPPTCFPAPPQNVDGFILETCTSVIDQDTGQPVDLVTTHAVFWEGTCQMNTHYDVLAVGGGTQKVYSVLGHSANFWVRVPVDFSVRACQGNDCSGFSSSIYHADYGC